MFEVFFERANHLSAARRLLADDVEYTSALALLAVHSAISWNDAVMVKLAGKPAKSESHLRAVSVLQKQCSSRKINSDGIANLRKLLAEKTEISYGGRKTTVDEARSLSISAERFETWAMRTLDKLK